MPSPPHPEDSSSSSSSTFLSRAVTITDAPLHAGEAVASFVLPPRSAGCDNPHPIRGLQLPSSSYVVPRGKCVVTWLILQWQIEQCNPSTLPSQMGRLSKVALDAHAGTCCTSPLQRLHLKVISALDATWSVPFSVCLIAQACKDRASSRRAVHNLLVWSKEKARQLRCRTLQPTVHNKKRMGPASHEPCRCSTTCKKCARVLSCTPRRRAATQFLHPNRCLPHELPQPPLKACRMAWCAALVQALA